MAHLSLKSLLTAKTGDAIPLASLIAALEGPVCIEDPAGNVLLGAPGAGPSRVAIEHHGAALGWVAGPLTSVIALQSLLQHLLAKELQRRALAAEVLHLYREVNLIDQLSEQLTALLDVSAVVESALGQTRRLISASSGGILIRRKSDGPLCYSARFGQESALPEPNSTFIGSVLERGVADIVEAGGSASDSHHDPARVSSTSLIYAPLRAKQHTVGVIVLASDAGHTYRAADLKLLNTIALQTAAAIENSMLCTEMVATARYGEQLAAIQRELDTARTIQHSLVPREFPPFPNRTDFDLHAQMTSARAVGGDFFDFFLIDDDHLGIMIGDVSGKGTPSALYMAVTHTHFRTVALRSSGPEECMAEVNRILVRDRASSMYATCFYGILDTRTREFRYSSAGHNLPYRISSGGLVATLECDGGTPLGLFPGNYGGAAVQLDPGDGLFLYTDGVPEAINSELEDFSDSRLVEVLRGMGCVPSRDIISTVSSELLAFTAGAPQSDDITMLAVRLGGV
jgi:sigma-B regulation protein RsbU (phosphoserine phosphatase)